MTESIVRSCSNLLEAFHHSYNMYAMLGAESFVTPEAYLVPAVLILAAFCIQVMLPPRADASRPFAAPCLSGARPGAKNASGFVAV